jgi:hypothetical protein
VVYFGDGVVVYFWFYSLYNFYPRCARKRERERKRNTLASAKKKKKNRAFFAKDMPEERFFQDHQI